jgi:hypothetical protein
MRSNGVAAESRPAELADVDRWRGLDLPSYQAHGRGSPKTDRRPPTPWAGIRHWYINRQFPFARVRDRLRLQTEFPLDIGRLEEKLGHVYVSDDDVSARLSTGYFFERSRNGGADVWRLWPVREIA